MARKRTIRSLDLVLRGTVAAEARAYGFSIVLLTSAYLAVSYHGLPHVGGAFAYLGGALAAQVAAAAVAFRSLKDTWGEAEDRDLAYYAPAAVHVVSVVLATLAAWGISAWVGGPHPGAFAAVGFAAVFAYEVVLTLELWLSLARSEGSGKE